MIYVNQVYSSTIVDIFTSRILLVYPQCKSEKYFWLH